MNASIRNVMRNKLLIVSLSLLAVFGGVLVAQPSPNDPFYEEFIYVDNQRIGERLGVKFPSSPTDTTRLTEITLSEERYYDADAGKYERRLIGIITGMGLGSTGLKLVLDDSKQVEMLADCMTSFIETEDNYLSYREEIEEKTEEWMGESWEALGEGRFIGEVYFYPSRRLLDAKFNWDFELERVWLSMGDRIIVDSEVVPYVKHILTRLDAYKETFFEYRKALDTKNKEIDALLGIDPR